MNTLWKELCACLCVGVVGFFLLLNYAETRETNALLKLAIRTQFQQHLDQTKIDDPAAVIRRFALGYTLQKEAGIWTDDEWNRINSEDILGYFQQHPKAVAVWKNSLRRYWTKDFVTFMDERVAKASQ